MASIGEQIKGARKAKGMTQDALAGAMKVSRSTVAIGRMGDACLTEKHFCC